MPNNNETARVIGQVRLLLADRGLSEDHADALFEALREALLRGELRSDPDRHEFLARQAQWLGELSGGSDASRREASARWSASLEAVLFGAEANALFDALAASDEPEPSAPSSASASFVWPAAGAMQVTQLPGGGCNIKITVADSGSVRSIGRGRVLKARNIPTRRIAQHYEFLIRHEDQFESSYSIVDQTPNLPAGQVRYFTTPQTLVEAGSELYEIKNGGFLHFQLSRAGRLVDPRDYIRDSFDGAIAVSREPPAK